ncbi:MAG: hypothetical protein IJ079_05765 [Lachnospiraceae bacterium]|nr:hypothetical protein [Lachnospiraceae bacterium]
MKMGILKTNGVHLEEHEYSTVKLLLEIGQDVVLIPTSQVKGMRTPDIAIDGVLWEMKSPTGSGKNTIKHTLQNASHQSNNVIVDLRRCKLPQDLAIKELEQRFYLSKRIRRMKIITNDEQTIDFEKK